MAIQRISNIGLAAALGFLVMACAPTHKLEPDKAMPASRVGLANPASVDCVNKGGELNIVTTSAGQIGVCTLKDGRQCEEWALFRDGRCVAPPPRS